MGLKKRLKKWEENLRATYNVEPNTPENRKKAEFYDRWLDHSILRHWWKNCFEIAPGVYRSNHPTRKRFEQLKERGITNILNLRGAGRVVYHLTEVEICEELGLNLISASLHASTAPPREVIEFLIETFKTIDKPFLMHCKSGADRTGLAAAVYLMVIEGVPPREARKQLSLRYLHIKSSKTGVLDHILETYIARNEQSAISFDDWIAKEYDADQLQAEFTTMRQKKGA